MRKNWCLKKIRDISIFLKMSFDIENQIKKFGK